MAASRQHAGTSRQFRLGGIIVRVHKFNAVAAAVACLGALGAAAAQAQDTQRIEITGSSIKRIASEGALPVQVINAEQIQRSGASTVAGLSGFLCAKPRRLVHGGGRSALATNRPTDAVGKSVPPCYRSVRVNRSP